MEEQFYLVWPLLIVILLPAMVTRRGVLKIRLLAGVSVISLASFWWSVSLSAESPGRAYFVTPTRVWEFGMGAALAIFLTPTAWPQRFDPLAKRHLPPAIALILAWVGLLILMWSALALPEDQPFPGWIAIVPVAATAFVILGGAYAPRLGPSIVLSVRPMLAIGAMSYSLYLWHWPLLVVADAALGPLATRESALVILLSAVPAYLAFRFVENPVRRWRPLSAAPRLGIAVGGLVSVGAAASALALGFAAPGAVSNEPPEIESQIAAVESLTDVQALPSDSLPDPGEVTSAEGVPAGEPVAESESGVQASGIGAMAVVENGGEPPPQADQVASISPDPFTAKSDVGQFAECRTKIDDEEPVECVAGDLESSVVVALVGDSLAQQWATAFDNVASVEGWRLVILTKAACSYTGLEVSREGVRHDSCIAWNEKIQLRLLELGPDLVVITGRDDRNLIDGATVAKAESRDEAVLDHERRLSELLAAGSSVLAMAETPNAPFDIPECASENLGSLADCSFEPDNVVNALVEAASAVGGSVLSMNDFFCSSIECPPVIGGVLVYRDARHASDTYIRTLTPALSDALEGLAVLE